MTLLTEEDRIIKELEGLIYTNLHRSGLWARFPTHREDMVQEGRVAIMKAIRTYKPEVKVKLSTYAYTLIRNAVYDYVQKMKLNQDYLIHPLFDDIVDSKSDPNLEAIAVLQIMEEEEHSDILKDYFILEYSQKEVAKKHNKKQQAISVIVNDFRKKVIQLFDKPEE